MTNVNLSFNLKKNKWENIHYKLNHGCLSRWMKELDNEKQQKIMSCNFDLTTPTTPKKKRNLDFRITRCIDEITDVIRNRGYCKSTKQPSQSEAVFFMPLQKITQGLRRLVIFFGA